MLKLTLAILSLFAVGSIIIYSAYKVFRDCEKEIYRLNAKLSMNMRGCVGPAASYKSPDRVPSPGYKIHREAYLNNTQLRNQIHKILESTSNNEYEVVPFKNKEDKKEGFFLYI